VSFPSTFTNTTWYQADALARFDLSAETLDDSFVGRRSPCKLRSGGCMGLDQALIQDTDGSFVEYMQDSAGNDIKIPNGTFASVVPYTPRTDIVWVSQCTRTLNGVDVGAQICVNTTVQLLEMHNLDRGAKDVKFGPLVLTPDVEEENGFEGGVLSSVGPFYAVCPCGWDFSFYHVLVKPNVIYDAEVMSLPENIMLRYWSPNPTDSIVVRFFYPDSRGVNVFVGRDKKPPMELKLARMPTKEDKHGAHVVDSQRLCLAITLRGSAEGFSAISSSGVRRR